MGLLEEEDGADGPSGGQGREQDRPVAASGPQPEEPEMMMVDTEGEGCFEDDEVQFVSETGAGQASTLTFQLGLSFSASGSSKAKKSLLAVRIFVSRSLSASTQPAAVLCRAPLTCKAAVVHPCCVRYKG